MSRQLVLFYFAESPFFDSTSNNASLAIQANYNDAFRHFVETREAFEARLKTMQGLEFIVSYDPLQAAAQTDNRFAHEPSNIWVIRKQNRRKRSGMDDEVTVISTYFIVGDCIYMAPSVASVVGNRIVCILSEFTNCSETTNLINPPPEAIGCHIPNAAHEIRRDITNIHRLPWTYLFTTRSSQQRRRRNQPGFPKQRSNTHARRILPNYRILSIDQQIKSGRLNGKLQLSRYAQSSRIIQSAHALRRRIHGRKSPRR